MSTIFGKSPKADEVIYPDSDGEPMAENTLQFQWICTIQGNLDLLFADRPDIFVAGDNLIYPVEGNNVIRQAPDIYVAFGRPKGHRGSYRVWEENGIFPQIVFEVLSPGNRAGQMSRRFKFYDKYGAQEYYILDPDRHSLKVYGRQGNSLAEIPFVGRWKSPRLEVTFVKQNDEISIVDSEGHRFRTFVELGIAADQERQRALQERHRAEQARAREEQARTREEQARTREEQAQARADRLAARLRELGVDPDAM